MCELGIGDRLSNLLLEPCQFTGGECGHLKVIAKVVMLAARRGGTVDNEGIYRGIYRGICPGQSALIVAALTSQSMGEPFISTFTSISHDGTGRAKKQTIA